MKKTGMVLCGALAAAIVLSGCGGSGAKSQTQTESGSAQEQTTQDVAAQSEAAAEEVTQTASAESELIDLTGLSTTVAYSEIYDMNVSPETYLGKTVRVKGDFTIYQNMDGDKFYYTCEIADTTACCAQGLEFILEGDPSIDEYPEMGEEIVVEGTFATYEEDGAVYGTLMNAELLNA